MRVHSRIHGYVKWLTLGLLLLVLPVLTGSARIRQTAARTALRFELSFAGSARQEAVDGRMFVVISKTNTPEPRLQIRGYTTATPFFGLNVDGLRPAQAVTIGERVEGYPVAHLSELPAGDYYVQGLLNIYTTFPRADGHIVKLHMDQWEGQKFERSPGNLYSEPQRIHLDPAAGGVVKLTLDKVIPPIQVPADAEHVKHVKFQSPLLSKFWGRPIFIGATILLPRDYDRNLGISYPVNYEQGHFSTANPGRFVDAAPDAKEANEFTKAWLSDKFPRMLYVTFQHPTPYYDDSYAIDSPNTGPYAQALTQEMIPYIESHFRVIPQPYARALSGGSTGGWEALALQIWQPDYFGTTWSFCPDPVDFHFFEMVNIYEWPSAWYRKVGWVEVPIPGERNQDGLVMSTMKQQLSYERALGDHGRSGEDWDEWQAAYGPAGDDGYFKPLFDPETGAIDKQVAAYWRDHTDITQYLKTHWTEVGPKLVGKIHIWVGDMDSFYLNNAVHLLDDFLSSTTNPPYGGSIVYGPRKPHCWSGPLSLPERLKVMAQEIAAHAPRDADTSWWRY
jgi:hypothetical protein